MIAEAWVGLSVASVTLSTGVFVHALKAKQLELASSNTKVGRYMLRGRHSACIGPGVKRPDMGLHVSKTVHCSILSLRLCLL